MIKLLGFVVIVISSAKIGFDISLKYIYRVKELKAFLNMLEKIKNNIKFSNYVISDALINLYEVKSDSVNKMFDYISKKIENEKINPGDAFKSFLENNTTYFEKCDIDEIFGFFASFGSSDRETEIKNIDKTAEVIKSNLAVALENEKKYVKFFRASGVLSGFLIAIILA